MIRRRELLKGAAGAVALLFLPKLPALPEAAPPTAAALDTLTPVGTVVVTSGKVPTGWLPCDGRVLDRSRWPKLADVLADRYDGAVPDFRGSVDYVSGQDDDAHLPWLGFCIKAE